MVYQRRLWNWRWELDISLKHWMGRSLEMAIFHFFDGCLSTFYSIRLSCSVFYFLCLIWETFQLAVSYYGIYVCRSHSIFRHFLTWLFRDDEKSLHRSDFVFSFIGWQSSRTYLSFWWKGGAGMLSTTYHDHVCCLICLFYSYEYQRLVFFPLKKKVCK